MIGKPGASPLKVLAIILGIAGVPAGRALASAIDDKYASLGAEAGFLGAPIGPETIASDGVGRFRHYQHGSIYIDPPYTAAQEVHGLIHQLWASLGFEKSYLGYPITDEENAYDGPIARVSKFQGGELIWRRSTNAVSQVKSTDLVVDLPTPVGEPWFVLQANAVGAAPTTRFGPIAGISTGTMTNRPPTVGRLSQAPTARLFGSTRLIMTEKPPSRRRVTS
jgi:uncharacterized protein with LGFP repeats